MRVFDIAKTKELYTYDLEKGYLRDEVKTGVYHPGISPIAEVGHYETIKTYENGGKDIRWVVDIPETKAQEGYYEEEKIKVYVPYTNKELAEREILKLKKNLLDTDYQAIKYAEGIISEYEYSDMKKNRQSWRNKINELEQIIK
jgi:hypothetical protein